MRLAANAGTSHHGPAPSQEPLLPTKLRALAIRGTCSLHRLDQQVTPPNSPSTPHTYTPTMLQVVCPPPKHD
ncbi:hypothetical protein E2C01_073801 [Portunus trituberculatus]|uniref:Uncharacterized protein n=1 Tax=Portunus trituberculatus TaxID=210409 RepID=A0A5B7IEU8_PORTR|nr:hypothetical protein [Portunus trituberculatus]